MMMQQPPTGGGGVHPSMDQQQQTQYSASPQPPQPTTTSSTAQEEEEEEEDHTVWIGNLQQWRHKVEKKEVRTLWIGDLQPRMDESYIDRCFVHTGEVFCSKVIRNKKTSECYGFIEFNSHDIAERFLHKFNGTPMPEVSGTTTNFNLNWASSFGSEEEEEEEEEEEDDICVIGDDDFAKDNTMLSQETFPTVNRLCWATETQSSSKEGTLFLRCGLNAEKVNSSWENMLKWQSIAKGTRTPQAVLAVLKVYAIGAFLRYPYCYEVRRSLNATEVEGMLDELTEFFYIIDVAKELHSFGALEYLYAQLTDEHASIRAKAAKVISTMVQIYPSSRLIIMNGNGRKHGDGGKHLYKVYWNYDDPTFETHALDAISLLYRNDDELSISAFREHCCALLRVKFASWNVDTHRKALNLIVRLVPEHDSVDKIIGIVLEYLRTIIRVVNSSDAVVRKAFLRFLSLLATVEKGNNAQVIKNDDMLKRVLEKWIEGTSEISHEDLDAAREEIQLLDSLWSVCYNEPSSLREKYPSFWKRAAFEAADTNSVGEQKKLHKVSMVW